MAAFNKIIIAGTQNNFTRIQTIAHECLHSVQDKRIQMFNFVFSNICILFFVTLLVLDIFNILPYKMLFLTIYILFIFAQYAVRAFLENDAMIKAKFIAKDYIKKKSICSIEEIDKLVNGFDEINSMGIKGYNFSLMLSNMIKVICLALVFWL